MNAAYHLPPYTSPAEAAPPMKAPEAAPQQKQPGLEQLDRQYPPYVANANNADPRAVGASAYAPVPSQQIEGPPSGYWPGYSAGQGGASSTYPSQPPLNAHRNQVPPPAQGSAYPGYPSATGGSYHQETYSASNPAPPPFPGAAPPSQPRGPYAYDSARPGHPAAAPSSMTGVPSFPLPNQSPVGELSLDTQDLKELCSGSEFVRTTLTRVPHSVSLRQKSHVPVGLFFRPLAPSDMEVPDVNFGSSGKVVRCIRCRTYVNVFSTWDSAGRRWTCNICGMSNEAPPAYCCPVDETGRRADRNQRPELNCGTVEFIATGDYMVRPPQPPTYLFLIDVSAASVASGLVATVCQGIKSALNSGRIAGMPRTQIGIMTFDSSVHFYKLDAQTTQPHMIVVPSLADVFVPLPDGVLVNLKECETQLRTLLDALPSMWSTQKVTESCLGTALTAAQQALKLWGGKLSVFVSVLPTLGERSLARYRDVPGRGASTTPDAAKGAATEKDAALLKPIHDEYSNLAAFMAQAQICVDIYACPPASPQHLPSALGLPTLAPLCRYTAGDLRYYPGFNALSHGDKLREEIGHVLTRLTAWEAVMRIRVSQGWKITKWTGHFYFRNADLLVLPNCHEDQTFGITLEHQENVVQDPFLYAQSALLYTNHAGERRIRIHNMCLPVTQSFGDLMASVDQQMTFGFLTHLAVEQALKTNLADARTQLQTFCMQIHSSLQQGTSAAYAAKDAPAAAMILPYHTLGLLKSAAFRDGRDITPDLRIYHWMRLLSLPLPQMISFSAPRLFALHDIAHSQYGMPNESQVVQLPPTVGLSASHMSQNGAYILEDGESMLLWLGKSLDPQWIRDVFGVDTVDHVHADHGDAVIGTTGSSLSLRIAAIVHGIRKSHLPFLKLTILYQGSPIEYKLFYALIEDKNHSCMISYDEFLSKLCVRPQPAAPTASQPPGTYSTGLPSASYAGYPTTAVSGGANVLTPGATPTPATAPYSRTSGITPGNAGTFQQQPLPASTLPSPGAKPYSSPVPTAGAAFPSAVPYGNDATTGRPPSVGAHLPTSWAASSTRPSPSFNAALPSPAPPSRATYPNPHVAPRTTPQQSNAAMYYAKTGPPPSGMPNGVPPPPPTQAPSATPGYPSQRY